MYPTQSAMPVGSVESADIMSTYMKIFRPGLAAFSAITVAESYEFITITPYVPAS